MDNGQVYTYNNKKDNGGAIFLIVVFCLFIFFLVLVLVASLAPHSWLGKMPWVKVFRIGGTQLKEHVKRCCHYNVVSNKIKSTPVHMCTGVDCECPQPQQGTNFNYVEFKGSNIVMDREGSPCTKCGAQ